MTPLQPSALSPAVAAAQSWAAAMRQRKQPCTMTPWDEATYCLSPKSTAITLASGIDSLIAASNPQRVALIIAMSATGGGTTLVNPGSAIDPANPQGMVVSLTMPPLVLLQKDVLNLVQVEWHALMIGMPTVLTVIEVILRDWPVSKTVAAPASGSTGIVLPPDSAYEPAATVGGVLFTSNGAESPSLYPSIPTAPPSYTVDLTSPTPLPSTQLTNEEA